MASEAPAAGRPVSTIRQDLFGVEEQPLERLDLHECVRHYQHGMMQQ